MAGHDVIERFLIDRMLSSFDRMGEILPWARLLLAIALAGWVIFRARTEVE